MKGGQANMENKDTKTSTTQLSEENLRIHDAACPKSDGYFQVNLIRQERARVNEVATYQRIFGDLHIEMDQDEFDADALARQAETQDVLRLYSASFSSLESPMNRFLAVSPANDAHPWLAKTFMQDSGIEPGSLEDLDARRIASEIGELASPNCNDSRDGAGSPRASSDTLSVRDVWARRDRGYSRGRPRICRKAVFRRQREKVRKGRSRSSSITFVNEDTAHQRTSAE